MLVRAGDCGDGCVAGGGGGGSGGGDRGGGHSLGGSGNEVFGLRSDNNIVIAAANTGKDTNNKRAVITTDQTNTGMRSNVIPVDRRLIIVVIKFTAPKIDESPAK